MTDGKSRAAYHESELRIAMDPSHPAHLLPPPMPEGARILDVGCGAGQTLAAAYPNRQTWGIEPDIEAVAWARKIAPHATILLGNAEKLPWGDGTFDFVFARVSLPYTNIPVALAEMYRVLGYGGTIWLALHPFKQVLAQAVKGNWKRKLFFLYIVANSLCLHFFGVEFRFRGKYESFQTVGGMRRALGRGGLSNVKVKNGNHFVVEATKFPKSDDCDRASRL